MKQEIERITRFIQDYTEAEDRVVVPVSGGLDSDLTARLCVRALGADRVKLFIVMQSSMEEKFLENARNLSKELKSPLSEIHLEDKNLELMQALEAGEIEAGIFRTAMLLDPAKAKCSLRSAVISSYQDKGFLIAGTTNRSERELGLFLTFGDNLAHFKPLAHLYKSELYPLAKAMGVQEEVICQEPSAGFWVGQTDMEDLAYWIVNDGPVVRPREFTPEEESLAEQLRTELSYASIDRILKMRNQGFSHQEILERAALSLKATEGILHIVEKAKRLRNRRILVELSN